MNSLYQAEAARYRAWMMKRRAQTLAARQVSAAPGPCAEEPTKEQRAEERKSYETKPVRSGLWRRAIPGVTG